ncbi:MAG: GTPase HflX [Methylococcaceae bacterium]|nr:GTPase HflX [Methylococcaceae bacterium]
MFERPGSGERAILVHMPVYRDGEDLDELHELARSAGVLTVATVSGNRKTPDPKFFVGKGKLEEIQNLIHLQNIDLILVNHSLSPGQERNLERALGVRVVDRNGLILDIFAQRAQSFEGKLQVELAQLQHLATRLVRGWTHLERQKGGIGLRGPGETQLETDRRLIGIRIRQIKRRLEKVDRQRDRGRTSRKKAEIPTVALVGYTNAGKSTLFNALSGANAYAADQLFATLDPTLRRITLPDESSVILADTVGFIRHLPHELVAAFRSTLQEVGNARLLLHVIDASLEDKEETIDQVNRVLDEIGAGAIPQLLVFNKIDLLEHTDPEIERNIEGIPAKVRVSARNGAGLAALGNAMADMLRTDRVCRHLSLSPRHAAIRASLFNHARILSEQANESGGWEMDVEIKKKDLGILKGLET